MPLGSPTDHAGFRREGNPEQQRFVPGSPNRLHPNWQGTRSVTGGKVRLWVLRIGLYRLLSAPLGPRWALICDHTATYAGVKLFVICGVDLDKLDQRVADGTGNFSLSQRDVVPLAIVPMAHSNAGILLVKNGVIEFVQESS